MQEAIDIYEHLEPGLIDKTTDTIWEFISCKVDQKRMIWVIFAFCEAFYL
jgi:hypothetical protein